MTRRRRPLPRHVAEELGAPGAAGLLIVDLDPGGPAAEAQLTHIGTSRYRAPSRPRKIRKLAAGRAASERFSRVVFSPEWWARNDPYPPFGAWRCPRDSASSDAAGAKLP